MAKLYANIGVGHENKTSVLEARLIAAAQCNADAVVITKSTPSLLIPEEKKYVSIPSRWGHLPYLEVAKRSELDVDTATHIVTLAERIGIPVVWCVTDSVAAEFVKEHCNATVVKLHHNAINVYELSRFCKNNFTEVIFNLKHSDEYSVLYAKNRKGLQIYYSTEEFPPSIEQLEYSKMDKLIKLGYTVGYESREPGVFPSVALAYKGVEFIEKYLGDEDSDNASILTPEQFYDYYKNLEILEIANG
jgi:sialic acid synthase SpsE